MLLAHLSDSHLTTGPLGAEPAAGLALAIGRALAVGADVLVVSGDLVERGTVQEYEELRDVLRRSPLPVHLVTGNHDRRAPLRQVFGATPHLPDQVGERVTYVVERDDVRLVVLDSLVEPGEPGDDVRGAGRLGPEQLSWLDAELRARPETPTLLALHHPPIAVGIGFVDAMNLLDAADLENLLREHRQVRGVLAGHVHRPVTGTLAGAVVSLAGSTYRQTVLDLAGSAPPGYLAEPTTFLLHALTASSYVVHTVAVSHAGARLAI